MLHSNFGFYLRKHSAGYTIANFRPYPLSSIRHRVISYVHYNEEITVLRIVIWGGIASVLLSEISFYGDGLASP